MKLGVLCRWKQLLPVGKSCFPLNWSIYREHLLPSFRNQLRTPVSTDLLILLQCWEEEEQSYPGLQAQEVVGEWIEQTMTALTLMYIIM